MDCSIGKTASLVATAQSRTGQCRHSERGHGRGVLFLVLVQCLGERGLVAGELAGYFKEYLRSPRDRGPTLAAVVPIVEDVGSDPIGGDSES